MLEVIFKTRLDNDFSGLFQFAQGFTIPIFAFGAGRGQTTGVFRAARHCCAHHCARNVALEGGGSSDAGSIHAYACSNGSAARGRRGVSFISNCSTVNSYGKIPKSELRYLAEWDCSYIKQLLRIVRVEMDSNRIAKIRS